MTDVKVKNKYFVIRSNDIEGRLDVNFYLPFFINTFNLIVQHKHSTVLGDLLENMSGGATPKVEEDFYTDEASGIPFLRVQNITEGGIKLDDIKYIRKEVHNEMLNRSQLQKDDLVFTITGRIGSVAVVPDNFIGNINQHSVRMKLKNEIDKIKINPRFVALFFNTNLGRNIAIRYTTGGTRPALDYASLKNLPLILPSLEVQNKVVQLMDSAYEAKAEKEKEANKILSSIDDYVLDELGIKVPKLVDKMCFVVNASDIQDKRIDPKGHSYIPKKIIESIRKSKYKTIKLLDIVLQNLSGEWGLDPYESVDDKYILAKVIRNTNFDNKNNLDLSDVAERYIEKDKFEKIKLHKGDLLIEKSGGSPIQPVGRVALIADSTKDYAFSNFLQCIKIDDKVCLPEFLFVFLKTLYHLGYMEYIQNQTTGIKNLLTNDFLNISTPLPDIKTQEKIADKYMSIINQSTEFRQKAKTIVEEAKKKVEKIILG